MRFRPCIDLHQGVVKQIVGGTLDAGGASGTITNFTSDRPPSYYARLYRSDGLLGGHVIMLGPGNEDAARECLSAWPGGLQVGGGITLENASYWIDAGACAVIVTSFVFRNGVIDRARLDQLCRRVGRRRLVLDLSCRRRGDDYYIVTDHWQKFTDTRLDGQALDDLSGYCSEFLVHAADVEGLCSGVEEEVVRILAQSACIPTTYAGGVRNRDDLARIDTLSGGRLDVTVGSALDLFGGRGIRYLDLVAWNRQSTPEPVVSSAPT